MPLKSLSLPSRSEDFHLFRSYDVRRASCECDLHLNLFLFIAICCYFLCGRDRRLRKLAVRSPTS